MSGRSSYDVAIIGSGPAGSSAALNLARAGVQVAVLEKAFLPRYKTCGGGLVGRATRLLPIDIGPAVEQECNIAEMHLHDAGLQFTTRRERPVVYMTMRDKLDFMLATAAREAGATVIDQCEVLDLVSHTSEVVLNTAQGPVTARFVLAADGAMSTTARKLGWPHCKNVMPGLEWEVTVGREHYNRFAGRARFDFVPFLRGYAWVFPKKGHLSIGMISMTPPAQSLKKDLAQYLRLIGLNTVQHVEEHGFLIPLLPREGGVAKGRIMLLGDAAGLADPVTGEGISFAIRSGQLAATALVNGDFQEKRVQQRYQVAIEQEILPELRAGRLLSKVLYSNASVRDWFFRRWGQGLCEAVTDVMYGERTFRSLLYNPTSYLKLFSLASDNTQAVTPTDH